MLNRILDHLFSRRERSLLRQASRRASRTRPVAARPRFFESLEPRLMLSAATLTVDAPMFQFLDADGDQVTVRLVGPGSAAIDLDADANNNADLRQISLADTTASSHLIVTVARRPAGNGTTTLDTITGSGVGGVHITNVIIDGQGIDLAGGINQIIGGQFVNGADIKLGNAGTAALHAQLQSLEGTADNAAMLVTPGGINFLQVQTDSAHVGIEAGGNVGMLYFTKSLTDAAIDIGGSLNHGLFLGNVQNLTTDVRGDINVSQYIGEADNLTIDAGGRLNLFQIHRDARQIDINVGGHAGLLQFIKNAADIDIAGNGRINHVQVIGNASGIAIGAAELGMVQFIGEAEGVDVTADGSVQFAQFIRHATDIAIDAGGRLGLTQIIGNATGVNIVAGGASDLLQIIGSASDISAAFGGSLGTLHIGGSASEVAVDVGGRLIWAFVARDADGVSIETAGDLLAAHLGGNASGVALTAGGNLNSFTIIGEVEGLDIDITGNAAVLNLIRSARNVNLHVGGNTQLLRVGGDMTTWRAAIEGQLATFQTVRMPGTTGSLDNAKLAVGKGVNVAIIAGDLANGSILAAGGSIIHLSIAGNAIDSMLLAGATLDQTFDLANATFRAAKMNYTRVGGDVIDSIISAGGDPGDDFRFADGEVIAGSEIGFIDIRGIVAGVQSPHVNPGVYTATIGTLLLNGSFIPKQLFTSGGVFPGVVGSAVIDPLPTLGNELTIEDTPGLVGIKTILARAVARARQLGVNATISIVDREGNVLAVVRTSFGGIAPAISNVGIVGGGEGGLEIVEAGGIVLAPASLAAISKAGTAAFLSTSGNAFTTRTAASIIQPGFPANILFQDSGPLYGVQFSSLPTSDVNRLPLGLSADPGGVPLYRSGEVVGGIGVEVDGIYTFTSGNNINGTPTIEEQIALAGQIGFQPPANIQADRIFVDGIRLGYAAAAPPPLAALAPALVAYDLLGGELIELFAPVDAPTVSKFDLVMLPGLPGIVLERPADASGLDFSGGFVDGAANGGEFLAAAEVETILTQAHALNHLLRAQIRRDTPQRSQVTVAVVDLDGNVLGVLRSADAPMFGYDVAVQKARTAAFFSRADAGAELREVDTELLPAFIETLFGAANPAPFGAYADAAAALGIMFDGSVAIADRTGGFLARQALPDNIPGAQPGPFSAILSGDRTSIFNTGLQTSLALPRIAEFLIAFNDERTVNGEAAALAAFINLTLGVGVGAAPGALPGNSLNNGMQIFAGSVPLYENGVLVGAIGVSGDGIEQDDYVAFAGATGFQQFGDVKRADEIVILGNLRLPYIKLPRSPFAGV